MKNIYISEKTIFGSGCDVIMTRMYRKWKIEMKMGKKPGNENKSKTDEFILFLFVEALCVPLFINLYIEFVL